MAVVPALATMAALTLLQNPAAQPEGVSVDYSPFAGPARRIQRAARRQSARKSAIVRIQSGIRRYPTVRQFYRLTWSPVRWGSQMAQLYWRTLQALLNYEGRITMTIG